MAESDVVDSSSSSKKKSKKWIQKYKPEYSQAFNFKSNHFALFLEPEFPPFSSLFLRPGLPYCHCPKLASLELV